MNDTSIFGPGNGREELFELVRSRSFKEGDFTLSSGKKSRLYFNMKPTMMDPRGAELSALGLLAIIEEVGADYIGGLEMGAVPVIASVAALSSSLGRPVKTFFVRKKPKDHGTQQLIEGLGPDETLDGKTILAIDDVATSGKSTLQAIEAMRAVGGVVQHAACLIDREEGGTELLGEAGVTLHSVFRGKEFLSGN